MFSVRNLSGSVSPNQRQAQCQYDQSEVRGGVVAYVILCSLITSPNLTFGFGTSLSLGLGIGGLNLGLGLDIKPGLHYKGFLKILMILYKLPSEIQ